MAKRALIMLSLLLGGCWTTFVTAEEKALDASEILARAIERARRNQEEANEDKYTYALLTVTETLDKSGDVTKVEERSYKSHHIEGVSYERLVEKDGRELTKSERNEEREREEKFRENLAEGKGGHAAGKARRNNSDDRVEFDKELVSRYNVSLVETRELRGRSCYVLAFVPKPGSLPKHHRMDEVLNNAAGTLWVDLESFEIARLRFELREKVSFWWGLVGSVSEMKGELDRRPVDGEVWLNERFELYLKGRNFFRSIHLREKLSWDEFARSDGKNANLEP